MDNQSVEQKALVAAVLRELAAIFGNVEGHGDYVGMEEVYQVDVVSTIQSLASALEERAEQLEKGEDAIEAEQ